MHIHMKNELHFYLMTYIKKSRQKLNVRLETTKLCKEKISLKPHVIGLGSDAFHLNTKGEANGICIKL